MPGEVPPPDPKKTLYIDDYTMPAGDEYFIGDA
jgi:hypothetical protein